MPTGPRPRELRRCRTFRCDSIVFKRINTQFWPAAPRSILRPIWVCRVPTLIENLYVNDGLFCAGVVVDTSLD